MPAGTSRYLDIAADLRTRILNGEWEPGANLPRMTDLARQYGVNRDTLARAIAILEAQGLLWAVPRRGTVVRHGMSRSRRPRGNLVTRSAGMGGPRYSFPSVIAQEEVVHHVPFRAKAEKLTDPRLARMLSVPAGSEVMRRHQVTGPAGEPPFQMSDSYIHPRGLADAPDVAPAAGSGDWLHLLEAAGHWPISWQETHRARMPTKDEASELQIPVTVPVLEIVRVGMSGKDGRPLEVTVEVIPSDRVEQVVVLECAEGAAEPGVILGSSSAAMRLPRLPEPALIVVAIVTSARGVLVARRNDGKPPWTFIGGEIEPGEDPAGAAIREVREETGLRIRTSAVIGRRVHPSTGREIVYLAASPTHETEALVCDVQDLAEVRWVDLAQADELMSGTIFEPVRSFLKRALQERDST